MSRVRTGHGPNDWSEPDEGVPAFLSGSAFLAGELVKGEPGYAERERLKNARKYQRRRPYIDPRDFNPQPRRRCGYMLPIAKEPCARLPGHKSEHRSRLKLDGDRLRQQRYYAKRRAAA